jgi:flagellar biosynthesis/type III secretory pathway protein FliH
MTSSSNTGSWQPLDLAGSSSGTVPGRTGFALSLVPEAAADPDAGGAGGPGNWLPSLHTTAEYAHQAREEKAFARGRAEASHAERERADARCRSALQAVSRVADHLEAIAGEFAQDRERDLQGLAVAVARHIVQHELTIAPERVGELVRRALALLPLDHSIEVRLNPEDLDALAASLEGLRPEGREVHVRWVADPSVPRGDFMAETPHRIVDGRTDVALRALYERFDHD